MPAGFREKISCALTGILTHPTGQVSACTTPWTLGPECCAILQGLHQPSIPVQASAPCQQCQRQAGRWLLLTSDRYQFQPTSQNKGSWFGNFPTFSRLFFPLSKSPASHYPNTLRLPPSWPKAFYHLPNLLFQTQPNPKVCQNSLLPSYCTENLK